MERNANLSVQQQLVGQERKVVGREPTQLVTACQVVAGQCNWSGHAHRYLFDRHACLPDDLVAGRSGLGPRTMLDLEARGADVASGESGKKCTRLHAPSSLGVCRSAHASPLAPPSSSRKQSTHLARNLAWLSSQCDGGDGEGPLGAVGGGDNTAAVTL